MGHTPFKLVYGKEVVMSMEYIFPSQWIAATIGMNDTESLEEHIAKLVHLEEDCFVTGFDQCFEKDQQKAWRDHHIKNKQFT